MTGCVRVEMSSMFNEFEEGRPRRRAVLLGALAWEKAKPAETVIHIDDEQYCQLTRALRPAISSVLKDRPVDVPGPDVSVAADEISQPPPVESRAATSEQPPGTPIV